MILVDDRTGSKELLPLIQNIGVKCELTRLEYGDAAFEGNGPNGYITFGVERKTLHDMLACIEDARYAAHQRPGMLMLYSKSFLCLEGLWCAGESRDYKGTLMQGFQGGSSWGPLRTKGGRNTQYSKLYRYLVSVALSGVIITYPTNLYQTAYQICELYQYFQKKWQSHTSLIEVQKLNIPSLSGKPSLVRRWASELTDAGVVASIEAEKGFKTAKALANADESQWLKLGIPGVGPKTARQYVREINGWK